MVGLIIMVGGHLLLVITYVHSRMELFSSVFKGIFRVFCQKWSVGFCKFETKSKINKHGVPNKSMGGGNFIQNK